jgi:biopolymer transport protein ExbD
VEGLRDGQWEPTDEVMGPQDRAWVAIADHPELAETAADLEAPAPHPPDETHLDMNALIDVCLVLLIFFMLTTTYLTVVQKVVPLSAAEEKHQRERGTRQIPKEQTQAYLKRVIRVEASGDKQGRLTVRVEGVKVAAVRDDGKTLDADKFREALLPYTRGEDRKTEMLLKADDVSWGMVIALQDAAKSAGVRAVSHYVPPRKK